jgi:hypothetical protein
MTDEEKAERRREINRRYNTSSKGQKRNRRYESKHPGRKIRWEQSRNDLRSAEGLNN